MILFDETTRQRTDDGTVVEAWLRGRRPGHQGGPGRRPSPASRRGGHRGARRPAGAAGRVRLAWGLRFAKWRAVSASATDADVDGVEANAHALARYAALAQEAGLVPIVEPEVLMDGAHRSSGALRSPWRRCRAVYAELARHRVVLEASLLKPNMVLPARTARTGRPDHIARGDDRGAAAGRSAAVPGIMFLSGGQSDSRPRRTWTP